MFDCLMFTGQNLNHLPKKYSAVHSYHTIYNDHLRINQCTLLSTIKSSNEIGLRLYNLGPNELEAIDKPLCYPQQTDTDTLISYI